MSTIRWTCPCCGRARYINATCHMVHCYVCGDREYYRPIDESESEEADVATDRYEAWTNEALHPGAEEAVRRGCVCSLHVIHCRAIVFEFVRKQVSCPLHGSSGNDRIAPVDEAENERTSGTVAVTTGAESQEVAQ